MKTIRSPKQRAQQSIVAVDRCPTDTWLSSFACLPISEICYRVFLSRTQQDLAEMSPIPCNYTSYGVTAALTQKLVSFYTDQSVTWHVALVRCIPQRHVTGRVEQILPSEAKVFQT